MSGFAQAVSKKKVAAARGSKAKKPGLGKLPGAPRLVSIPDRLGGENLRAHVYKAEGRASGLVVLAPGSRGGMGPGQTPATIGKFDPSIRCTYPLLSRQLAARGIACIHFTWRLNPTRKGAPPGTLKSPVSLLLGVEDISLAARYLRAQYKLSGDSLPLVLVGFSFGGPSVMAAGACAVAVGGGTGSPGHGLWPLAGVVTIGCGMRVSKHGSEHFKAVGLRLVGGASKAKPHEYGGIDSESCVDAFAAANLPLAMIHGLADVTVDPAASLTIFERARGPKAALWLRGADHHGRQRFDDILATLADWVPALLQRPVTSRALETALADPWAGMGEVSVDAPVGQAEPPDSAKPTSSADIDVASALEDEALSDEADEFDAPLIESGDAESEEDDVSSAQNTARAANELPEDLLSSLNACRLQPERVPPPQAPPDVHCAFLSGEACTQ